MTDYHGFADAGEFIDSMYEALDKDVERNIENMSGEECCACTRDFLRLMEEWQPATIDLDSSPLEGAAHGIYLAKLIPLVFKKAYLHSNSFLAARESVRKALEDL